MKRILLAGATLLALATAQPTLAADAPVYRKAPPPTVAAYNWSGLYVGIQGGYAWGNYNWAPEFPSVDNKLEGWFGGGTVGYNWQLNSLVLGAEADWSWANIKGDHTGGVCSGAFSCSAKVDSFGTLRGRLGVLVTPSALLYGTGGWAWGRVARAQFTAPVGLETPDFYTNPSGWTAGGGIEMMVAPNWTVKVEYLYIDLGSQAYPAQNTLSPSHQAEKFSIIRFGANYKFW